jgi:hypothetical protein
MPSMPTHVDELGFHFGGQNISAATVGEKYLSEFDRILKTYATDRFDYVLEWGSGVSTQILVRHAEQQGRTKLLLTLDTNGEYQKAVFSARRMPSFLRAVALDPIGPRNSQSDPELNYSTYPLGLGQKFDFIYVDGRRRLECALVAALLSHSETIMVLHDYRRRRYQPVVALFDVEEDGQQFRVCRLRRDALAIFASPAEEISARMVLPND